MQPTTPVISAEFQQQELVYAKDQPEYNPLPVHINSRGVILSRWKLSDAEREAIVNGADIWLYVCTFNQPLQPLRMQVPVCSRDVLESAQFMELID